MAAPHSSNLENDKAALRARMRAIRRECDPASGARLATTLLALARLGQVVGGYWPLPGEIDLRTVLVALARSGYRVGLPLTPAGAGPLSFRRWWPGAALRAGRFGTMEPDGEALSPDVLLVPLLAVDRAGRRLGYGGGFYDRTLAARRVRAIGCGFAAQVVDRVPSGPHDRTMDAIATERGVMEVRVV